MSPVENQSQNILHLDLQSLYNQGEAIEDESALQHPFITCTSPAPSTSLRQKRASNILHMLFSSGDLSWADPLLEWIRTQPSLVYRLLTQRDHRGHSAFSVSVYQLNHKFALEYFSLISERSKKRDVLMTKSDCSNLLHAAAARGNIEFTQLLLQNWQSWGLFKEDMSGLLHQKEVHGETPLGMAQFQRDVRKQDRHQVIQLLQSAMQEFPLYTST